MIDFITRNPFPGHKMVVGKVENALDEGGEGKLDLILPKNVGGFLPLERSLIGYSEVELGDKHWYYATSYPFAESFVYVRPFIIDGLTFIVISYTLLLLFSVRLARLKGRQEGKQ